METNAQLQEIERELAEADRLAEAQVAAGGPAPAVGEMVRWALARAVATTEPPELPPALLVALVRAGLWDLETALGRARGLKDGLRRGLALADLAALAPVDEQDGLYLEAVAAARTYYIPPDGLVELAPVLPDPYRTEAYREAITIAGRRPWDHGNARLLVNTAPDLPEDVLPDALGLAAVIKGGHDRASALGGSIRAPGYGWGLAPYLPPELMPRALVLATELGYGHDATMALAGLAPYLPVELLPQALEHARRIAQEEGRPYALAAVTASLARAGDDQAPAAVLALVREIDNDYTRAHALATTARCLPAGLMPEALAITRALEIPQDRWFALCALSDHAAEPLRSEMVREAWASAREYTRRWPCVEPLVEVAARLPGPEKTQVCRDALVAVRSANSEALQEMMLAGNGWVRDEPPGLIAVLPEALLGEALAVVQEMERPGYEHQVLDALAPRLPAELLSQALATAWNFEPGYEVGMAINALAPRLPADLLPEALAIASTDGTPLARIEALAEVAGSLSGPAREEAIAEVLSSAAALRNAHQRCDALCALSALFPGEALPDAIAAARALPLSGLRAVALAALAPRLPLRERARLREWATELALAIRDPVVRTPILGGLASELPLRLKRRIVASLRQAEAPDALAEVALDLPAPLQGRAFRSAFRLLRKKDSLTCYRQLSSMAEFLPPRLLPELVAVARGMKDAHYRDGALALLARALSDHDAEAAQAVALEIVGEKERASLLAELSPHPPAPAVQEVPAGQRAEPPAGRPSLAGPRPAPPPDLEELAERIPDLSPAELFATCRDALQGELPAQLEAVRQLVPFVEALGGAPALDAVAQALLRPLPEPAGRR